MQSNRFDAIVVGGGPAGSMAAYFLAKSGVRTALVDAHAFPRAKACGGGLQVRTMQSIPFDVSHLLRGSFNRMTLTFGLRDPLTRAYPDPFGYSILRTEFDHFLLLKAEQAGARVFLGSPVRSLEVPEHGPVTVAVGASELKGEILVGADGANSVVRARINRREDYFWQAAVYCEVPEEEINAERFSNEAMVIDWGTLPSGYAWAFPKRGFVNVGAGGPVRLARHLKQYVQQFVDSTRLLKRNGPLALVGHQLPTMTSRSRLSARRVLLVGDAAGMVEPFTGDGISFACQSAKIASDCILDAFARRDWDLRGYDARIRSEIVDDLVWSRKLLSISVSFPSLIYKLFRSNDRVWNTFCRTLRGEETFHRLKKDVLGPFEFAWKAIEVFAKMRERAVLGT
jgi:geranylgeranyl reductase family protein